MAQVDDLRVRIKDVLNADRSSNLYKEARNHETGCVIFTIKSIYEYFFPGKPLPRDFETRIRKELPRLEDAIFKLADIYNQLHLGFEADYQVVTEGFYKRTVRDSDFTTSRVPFRTVPDATDSFRFNDHGKPDYGLLDTLKPCALVLLNQDGDEISAHIMPWTGQHSVGPHAYDGINHGGMIELSTFQRNGYKAFMLIHFKKSE